MGLNRGIHILIGSKSPLAKPEQGAAALDGSSSLRELGGWHGGARGEVYGGCVKAQRRGRLGTLEQPEFSHITRRFD